VKIRADEHVAEAIVRAVQEIALSPGWELSHVISSGYKGSTDEHWATQFAKEGGNAILSADTDFFRRHHQIIAICDTGLKIIHLPSKWATARGDLQAAHILLWWRRVEAKISIMTSRQCYCPPWNITESGDLKQVKVNYEEARKKERKYKRRTGR